MLQPVSHRAEMASKREGGRRVTGSEEAGKWSERDVNVPNQGGLDLGLSGRQGLLWNMYSI